MTYSQAKIDAYKKLDEAIAALDEAFKCQECEQGNRVVTGYVLLTSSIVFNPIDKDDEFADDLDKSGEIGFYSARGQDPYLTSGILKAGQRHYDQVNERFGAGD